MNPVIYASLCLVGLSCAVLALDKQPEQATDSILKQNASDEMHAITKSLEDLLVELGQIKREATGRLSLVKNRASTTDQERIRQTKVSRFVLNRVAELESESLSMREELAKLFNVQKLAATSNTKPALYMAAVGAKPKQEDIDFDELPLPSTQASPSTTDSATSSDGMPVTTTMKPDEEAAKLGFDMEALKKLGEEIGKRLDQFGKDAAKNLAELVEGVKLVFREPSSQKTNPVNNTQRPAKTKIVYDIATLAPPKA